MLRPTSLQADSNNADLRTELSCVKDHLDPGPAGLYEPVLAMLRSRCARPCQSVPLPGSKEQLASESKAKDAALHEPQTERGSSHVLSGFPWHFCMLSPGTKMMMTAASGFRELLPLSRRWPGKNRHS